MIPDRSRRSLLLNYRTVRYGALDKYNGEASQSRPRLLHLGVRLNTTPMPRFHHGSDYYVDILLAVGLHIKYSVALDFNCGLFYNVLT
jgi:hypothetical protein